MAVRRSEKPPKPEQNTDVFASCSFSSLGLDSAVCDQLRVKNLIEFHGKLERLAFEAPTRVQAEAIPVILSGRHVLVNASTGSGKTVAYLAPVINCLQQYSPRIQRCDGTFALVLVPTHELCSQVYEILQKLLHRFHWIVPGCVMGGEKKTKEKARLRKGISILVATPGRLLDHLKMTSSFKHSNLRWIIFDEADRILEQGYGKAIEEILNILGSRADKSVSKDSAVPSKYKFERQNLLLSATLNEKVNHLAQISLENPVMIGMDDKRKESSASHVYLGEEDDSERRVKTTPLIGDYNLPSQLNQKFVKVPCNSRLAVLLSIIKHLYEREASQKVVVFFSTCDAVDFHHKLLSEFQFTPMSKPDADPESELKHTFVKSHILRLHGSMNQEDRKATFMAFKTEKCALLLSTDVAARGLDFPKVRCIIQYDSPGDASEYVHRVGRTARLGERGESLLFLQPIEADYLKDLEKHNVVLTEFKLSKVLDSFPFYEDKNPVKKFVPTDSHPWVMALQKALEAYIASQMKVKSLAQKAYCSWIRAYAAHRGDLKRIFVVKKLHLGHVAKSFALKEQPSLVVKSFLKQDKKRKMREGNNGPQKKRRVAGKTR